MKLSIIIPTFNESHYLPITIDGIHRESVLGSPYEIIVADCGSTDGTRDVALHLGCEVVCDNSDLTSRASALNKGASHASGDILLFLDADTIVPYGFDELMRNELEQPGVVGGAFEFALDGSGFGLRLIEVLNRIRYRIWPRYFGDQGIFVRADVFYQMNGYPNRRIMEASDFCFNLRRMGKLRLIRKHMKTSPRRFIEGGLYRVLAKDILIWWLDLIGLQTEQFADAYQENNRRRGQNSIAEHRAKVDRSF